MAIWERIRLHELQALGRQAVDIRCRVVALAVATHVGIAKIVGQDEDDIGLGDLCDAGATRANSSQYQRTCGCRLDKPATSHRVLTVRHVFPPEKKVTFRAQANVDSLKRRRSAKKSRWQLSNKPTPVAGAHKGGDVSFWPECEGATGTEIVCS